jgi:hypothetical protein
MNLSFSIILKQRKSSSVKILMIYSSSFVLILIYEHYWWVTEARYLLSFLFFLFFGDKDPFFSSTLHAIVYPIIKHAKKCIYAHTHTHCPTWYVYILFVVKRFAFMSNNTDTVHFERSIKDGHKYYCFSRTILLCINDR